MKPTVYIETTVISYLTAWPSRDLIIAANQRVTLDWWQTQRDRFKLFTSELVILEASGGDSSAASERLKVLSTLAQAESSDHAQEIASALIAVAALPLKSVRDALHVGIAAVNGIDFLLTWNCRHLANAMMRPKIEQTCEHAGYKAPVICTPKELFDEAYYA